MPAAGVLFPGDLEASSKVLDALPIAPGIRGRQGAIEILLK